MGTDAYQEPAFLKRDVELACRADAFAQANTSATTRQLLTTTTTRQLMNALSHRTRRLRRGAQDLTASAGCSRRRAAAGADEAGFCPVISRPSMTTYGAQSSDFE